MTHANRLGILTSLTGFWATIGLMFRPEHPLQTTRLTLRPFGPGDFDDLYAYQSRPDVAWYLHWDARDHAQVREVLVRQCDETSLSAEGDWLTFAVVWREAGKVVGEVGLKLISWENRQGEIGFVFNPDYHERGLAATASLRSMEEDDGRDVQPPSVGDRLHDALGTVVEADPLRAQGRSRSVPAGPGRDAFEHCHAGTLAGSGCGWLAGRPAACQIRAASRTIAAANGSMYRTTMAPPED
jgi:hypothetical protein